jgi:hypothetical protein
VRGVTLVRSALLTVNSDFDCPARSGLKDGHHGDDCSRQPVHGTKDAGRVAIGSGVGAVIETYDLPVGTRRRALLATPSSEPSPLAGTLLSFATLASGSSPGRSVASSADTSVTRSAASRSWLRR